LRITAKQGRPEQVIQLLRAEDLELRCKFENYR